MDKKIIYSTHSGNDIWLTDHTPIGDVREWLDSIEGEHEGFNITHVIIENDYDGGYCGCISAVSTEIESDEDYIKRANDSRVAQEAHGKEVEAQERELYDKLHKKYGQG